jgi:hypothetical protein
MLDSGFGNFVSRNSNILPDWFTQAIQSYDPMLEITLRKNLLHTKKRQALDNKDGHIHG